MWEKCGEKLEGTWVTRNKGWLGGPSVGKEREDKRVQENVILKVSWLLALKRAVVFNIAHQRGGFHCSIREWMRSFHTQQGHAPCLCCWGITESHFPFQWCKPCISIWLERTVMFWNWMQCSLLIQCLPILIYPVVWGEYSGGTPPWS